MFFHNLFTISGLVLNIVGVMFLLYSDWHKEIFYGKRKDLWKTAKSDENGNLKELSQGLSKKELHRIMGLVLLILGFATQLIATFV